VNQSVARYSGLPGRAIGPVVNVASWISLMRFLEVAVFFLRSINVALRAHIGVDLYNLLLCGARDESYKTH
jgi:hypothetical protein